MSEDKDEEEGTQEAAGTQEAQIQRARKPRGRARGSKAALKTKKTIAKPSPEPRARLVIKGMPRSPIFDHWWLIEASRHQMACTRSLGASVTKKTADRAEGRRSSLEAEYEKPQDPTVTSPTESNNMSIKRYLLNRRQQSYLRIPEEDMVADGFTKSTPDSSIC
ncbi:hypothetical protein B0H67DRAFT_686275 [Lasiosphaeris hirsuta]|uniref:Uncharacterized protein n=1 Tax=Lasiosphaeris hirsuta TaxID=260670 RepID=A0AA40A2M1_9PEZI|nr:hypothetical protein B0H67DRAFT_686275 [Lasiosphaeris hirsuta]